MTILGFTTAALVNILSPRMEVEDYRVADHAILLGCACCDGTLIEGSPAKLLEFAESLVSRLRATVDDQAARTRSAIEQFPVTSAGQRRGAYEVHPTSVTLGYDEDAWLISGACDDGIAVYRRSDDEMAAAAADPARAEAGDHGQEYLVGFPGEDGDDGPVLVEDEIVWRRFTGEQFAAWLAAYGLGAFDVPPGEQDTVWVPAQIVFQPLT